MMYKHFFSYSFLDKENGMFRFGNALIGSPHAVLSISDIKGTEEGIRLDGKFIYCAVLSTQLLREEEYDA